MLCARRVIRQRKFRVAFSDKRPLSLLTGTNIRRRPPEQNIQRPAEEYALQAQRHSTAGFPQ